MSMGTRACELIVVEVQLLELCQARQLPRNWPCVVVTLEAV